MTDLDIGRLAQAFRSGGRDLDPFRHALNAARDAVVIALVAPDLANSPIAYVNPAFEAMTGFSAAEAIGQDCRFLQRTDRLQPATRVIRAAIESGTSCCVVLRNYREDGTMFHNELSLAPIRGADGRIWSYIGIQREVT